MSIFIIEDLKTKKIKKIKIVKEKRNKWCCKKCGLLSKKCGTAVICRHAFQFLRDKRF